MPRIPGAVAALVAAGLVLTPDAADAGFFEQLFGMEPAPQAQPAPSIEAPVLRRRRPIVRKHVVAEPRSGRQTPTDLMHDATLHQGDAVMTRDGLRVYRGGFGGVHDADDFVPLDESGLGRQRHAVLAAADTSRASVASGEAGRAGTLASGRSAAVSAPIADGFMFTDPRGRRLRYVGP